MAAGDNLGNRSGISFDGLEEVQELLSQFAVKEARLLNRNTVHAIAVEIKNQSKVRAPRDSGTLKRALKAVRRKPRDPDKPFSDVRVDHGKDVRNDAFYWHFQEYGTVNHEAKPFIRPSIDDVRPRIIGLYKNLFGKKLEERIRRKARKAAGLIK